MKSLLKWIASLGFCVIGVMMTAGAYDAVTTQILHAIDTDARPREAIVQWYYALDQLYTTVSTSSGTHPWLPKIQQVKTTLRTILDSQKKQDSKDKIFQFFTSVWPQVTTPNTLLSADCKARYQLVDDRSYALNLPTPLVLATLDIESSCGRYKPSNGDGVFQLVAKDYGTGTLTTGQWIMMMYDFSALVSGKYSRYHNSNKLSPTDCSTKNLSQTGQIAPICLTYGSIDFDSLVKHSALYNGLSGAIIKWDIQPAAPVYLYGHYTDAYSGSIKDGLATRVLKAIQYMRTL